MKICQACFKVMERTRKLLTDTHHTHAQTHTQKRRKLYSPMAYFVCRSYKTPKDLDTTTRRILIFDIVLEKTNPPYIRKIRYGCLLTMLEYRSSSPVCGAIHMKLIQFDCLIQQKSEWNSLCLVYSNLFLLEISKGFCTISSNYRN